MKTFKFIRAISRTMRKTTWCVQEETLGIRTIKNGHCPVTFAVKTATGIDYKPCQYREASILIGVPINLADLVAGAADDSKWKGFHPVDISRLRRILLKSAGL